MATEQQQARRVADGAPLEKDFSRGMTGTYNFAPEAHSKKDTIYLSPNGYDTERLDPGMDSAHALRRIRTAGSVTMSPELFEKLYLTPEHKVKGDLRQTFGNPTPLALLGFLLSLSPLSCDLMGWRGAGGSGAASIGAYFFFGGLLMVLGGLGEWVIGNTFPFVVFSSFGAFWLTFGATLQPFYNASGAYATDPADLSTGLESVGFNASLGFYWLTIALMCFLYLILALRTNVVFVLIFLSLVILFTTLTGGYFYTASGDAALAHRLIVTAGASGFVTCACGWWIFFAIMLAALDFPFQLPVGDLSTLIKSGTQRREEREKAAAAAGSPV
ncbi:uncharacterized protein K452DRAFT_306136 [Aplosporella prunicola CBS 121167]|uniref:GPR1/FUN34/YaaH-class plasma membrane protein n=1 Tax=Aplosporella prunicola CBS 121167 TaxID=1176127 RepID=A0A6A6BM57_9PEZI|nr:uncharacterized protein K452DRAFT_306136 [Aplosporella prunicola CBS 121167]KAF2145220.1 hypothetical protein K452DRAFT_306136 [Aplosporella prunicola CBS 121167]